MYDVPKDCDILLRHDDDYKISDTEFLLVYAVYTTGNRFSSDTV
jgi:hypothetical protein